MYTVVASEFQQRQPPDKIPQMQQEHQLDTACSTIKPLIAADEESSQREPRPGRLAVMAGTHHGAQLHAGLQGAQVDGAVAGALADATGRRRHLFAAKVLQVVAIPNLPAAHQS
jgi:hypothetical protein